MKTRKRKPIKPHLPTLEEIQGIFQKRDGRRLKKPKDVQPEPELVKCFKNPPGRPKKWLDGDQMRLSTRVRPSTHKTLHAEAKKYKMSVGELLDVWFSPFSPHHEYQDRILRTLEDRVEDRRLNK
tara:strand:- start:2610 stop:2984 length:375 start_codon:yes stop_codon:yes gene_type:complete